jgi:hypothetical protein
VLAIRSVLLEQSRDAYKLPVDCDRCFPGDTHRCQVGSKQGYERPPREIVEILDAPAPACTDRAPGGERAAPPPRPSSTPISDLAESVIRGASVRINLRSNGHYLFA